jgi:FKBP-type peptidyl-prolyl cis-trans isomerase
MRCLSLLLLLLFTACGGETPPATATEPTVPRESEEDRLLRLSSELTADTSRAGRERNAIINTAIDQAWSLEAAPEGYFYEILDPGTREETIQWGDRVRAHYSGRFLDGRIFDDSRRRNRPLEFYVGNMIDSWNQGLQRLRPGGRMRLVSPSALAYGAEGLVTSEGDTLVPPHQVLVFELEVLGLVEG